MKSLHVLGSSQFGGADRFYVRLIQALAAAGHETVAVNRPGSPVAEALAATPGDLPVRQYHLPFANKWDFATVLRLRALVRRERPAVVQSYMGRATRLTRLPRSSGATHIARLGGYYKLNGYYRHCDAWVGNTQGICDYLVKEGFPPERVFRIGNFVPPPPAVERGAVERARSDFGLSDDAWVLFALGRFIRKKGFDDALRAFARLPKERHGRPVHLLLAGDGPLNADLRSLAAELDIGERVHWTGWRDEPEVLFALADALVCPSRHEPLGNVILEGWNHGLPVVSTRTLGACELISDGIDGLLAPCEDPEGLARVLGELLASDDTRLGELAAAGKAVLAREHSEAAVVGAYGTLYHELESGRGGKR